MCVACCVISYSCSVLYYRVSHRSATRCDSRFGCPRDTRPPAGPAEVLNPGVVQSLAAHATKALGSNIFPTGTAARRARCFRTLRPHIYSYDVRRGGKAYGLPCGSGLSVQCSTAALGALQVEVEVHKAGVQRTHCPRGDYFHTTPRPSPTAAPTCTRCNLRTCVCRQPP